MQMQEVLVNVCESALLRFSRENYMVRRPLSVTSFGHWSAVWIMHMQLRKGTKTQTLQKNRATDRLHAGNVDDRNTSVKVA